MILPDQTVRNPPALVQALIRHRVTHLTAVPTLLQALLPYLQSASRQPLYQSAASAMCGDVLRGKGTAGERPKALALDIKMAGGSDRLQQQSDNDSVAEPDRLEQQQQSDSGDIVNPSDVHQQHNGYSVYMPKETHTPSAPVLDGKLSLRLLISSGEPLSSALAQSLKQSLPDSCRLLNLYGSTEAAADCTCFVVPALSQASSSPRKGPADCSRQASCRTHQVRSDQARTDVVRSDQVRTDQVRSAGGVFHDHGRFVAQAQAEPVPLDLGSSILRSTGLVSAHKWESASTAPPGTAPKDPASARSTSDPVVDDIITSPKQAAGMHIILISRCAFVFRACALVLIVLAPAMGEIRIPSMCLCGSEWQSLCHQPSKTGMQYLCYTLLTRDELQRLMVEKRVAREELAGCQLPYCQVPYCQVPYC